MNCIKVNLEGAAHPLAEFIMLKRYFCVLSVCVRVYIQSTLQPMKMRPLEP